MDNGIFIELCKSIVVNYFNANVDKTDKKKITKDKITMKQDSWYNIPTVYAI